jgi:glycosyltransferase involved in cell wall biosynthesis
LTVARLSLAVLLGARTFLPEEAAGSALLVVLAALSPSALRRTAVDPRTRVAADQTGQAPERTADAGVPLRLVRDAPTSVERVLLCTEGTYPFVGGGVSTWCDILCRQLPDVEFVLFSVTGAPEMKLQYDLPPNARSVLQVPLWGMQEPAEYVLDRLPYSDFLRRKRCTSERLVEELFVPQLRTLLRCAADESLDVGAAGEAMVQLWRYFQEYDWNKTWKARATWDAFVTEVLTPYREGRVESPAEGPPSVADLTTSLRWTYNLLLPLVAPLPEVDLVHATVASFAAVPGVVAKLERGTPFLLTEHGIYVRERYIAVSAADLPFHAKRYLMTLTGLMSRLCYRYADVVAPVADYNKRWEVRYGAEPSRIETVYNGIDPHVFRPAPKPADLTDVPVAVAAARLFPLKDIETMIRSADVARRSLPDVRFLVYGSLDADRPYVSRCRALIEELGLSQTFQLRGFHSSPAEVYNMGDISVLSSISEGFPYTVLESMSCARPVVATDVGGVKEALEGFGVVVPPRDAQALGQAAVELLKDPERRLDLGRRARAQVLERYRTSHSVDSYRMIYHRLVTQARQPVDIDLTDGARLQMTG